jgi:hypothetical protein
MVKKKNYVYVVVINLFKLAEKEMKPRVVLNGTGATVISC